MSSEWYYNIHTVTGAINETGLVTGYLKSIEQLLYALIRLSINKNRRIAIDASKKNQFTKKKKKILKKIIIVKMKKI